MTEPTATRAGDTLKRRRVIEQIALTIQTSGVRSIAIGSVKHDPAWSAMARDVASVCAKAGLRSVVVDVSGSEIGPSWIPGDGRAQPAPDADDPSIDVVSAANSIQARAAFNNRSRLSVGLTEELAGYDLVVLSLAGLGEDRDDRVNAVAAASAADGVLLVCPTNQIAQSEFQDTINAVLGAGGTIVGTVMDDRSNPMLGDDMARVAQRALGFMPPLARWAAKRLRSSAALNSPIYS